MLAPRVVQQREGVPIDLVGLLTGIPFCSRIVNLIKRKMTTRKKKRKGKIRRKQSIKVGRK